MSDSLISIRIIQNRYATNQIAERIHILLKSLIHQYIRGILVWIPGHHKIAAHDAVDSADKPTICKENITTHFHPPPQDRPTTTRYYKKYVGRNALETLMAN